MDRIGNRGKGFEAFMVFMIGMIGLALIGASISIEFTGL